MYLLCNGLTEGKNVSAPVNVGLSQNPFYYSIIMKIGTRSLTCLCEGIKIPSFLCDVENLWNH